MNAKVMIFAGVLCIVGLVLFAHGTSLSNQVMDPESLISGMFLVVVGIFFGFSGFSYVDSADVSAPITELLKPKCEVRLGELPTL